MARPAIYHPLHERYDCRTMEKEKTQKIIARMEWSWYFVISNKPVAADKNSATTKSRAP
jgi:hypothetical protein